MALILLIIGLVVLVFSSIWRGYVLSVVWAWFMVPTFGLPALGIASAIGVGIVISFMTYQHIDQDKNDKGAMDRFVGAIFVAAIYPLMVLGIGWVVLQFM